MSSVHEEPQRGRRSLDIELDQLEAKLNDLRILFEQYFVDVQPQPPVQQQKEVVRQIKKLLRAPFKNSQTRFRLRTLVTRYQTYHTYWERVMKQREEGSYFKDVFKAELRVKITEDQAKERSRSGTADKGMHQLFDSYRSALEKAGVESKQMNFDAFKKSLVLKAKELKEKHGVKKLNYKVVVKNGKVTIKASGT